MADRYLIETSATDGYLLEDDSGVLLLEVLPGSPAARASLRVQDVIVSIDGQSVAAATDISKRLDTAAAEGLDVTFLRGSRLGKTKVVL